jgi:hypothetical protein
LGQSLLSQHEPQVLVRALQPGSLAGQSAGPRHCTHWSTQNGVPASSAPHCASLVQPAQPSSVHVVPAPASTHSASIRHWTQKPAKASEVVSQ